MHIPSFFSELEKLEAKGEPDEQGESASWLRIGRIKL
jgi:hypothetical protein